MKLFLQYRNLPSQIYILFYGRIVTSLGSMVWPMLTMILNQKMGMSASQISQIIVLAGIIMIPAYLLGGKLADRFSKKRNIVLLDSLSIAFYIISAFQPLSMTVICLIIAAAVFQSMEQPSYNALVADLTYTKDRERAYSLLYLGSNLGLILSPTISGFLFRNHLWLAFLISGISIASSTILIQLKINDITPVQDDSEEAAYQTARDDASLLSILKENKVLLLFVICTGLYQAVYMMWGYLMPLDLGRIHGENGAVIYGTINSLNCLIVVLFTPLITRRFARFHEPQKILIAVLLIGLGYLIFLLNEGTIPFYYIAIILFTWGEIFETISDAPYTANRIPSSHRGRISGFSTVIQALIAGFFQIESGHLYDRISPSAAWIFVLSANVLAASLCAILIHKDRKAYPDLYE
jgi:MFS family permease